ncbi:TatD family hydrolase [Desulfoscipio gibsoniae]|uniref:Hydrolase, TatD family n=1 Tax=Desulfoscipio gibsoniae DSM 7213 TaxID=767817 RepID=R4K956_9FIRM|nr:TatD family hydrolase [Desulfoscipio gibsoniae]AGK99712.1 hydrolase, TatD family [Desulfoscipio gibsoniae DSM 7213]
MDLQTGQNQRTEAGRGLVGELFDTHAHLYDEQFTADLEQVFDRMAQAKVTRVLCVGYDVLSSEKALSMAENRSGVTAAVGVHPHDAEDVAPDYLTRLTDLARHPRVAALGEIGLDYYRDLSPRPVQQRVFREQLALVRELGMPVIIHVRDAFGDLLDILRRDGISPAGGVMHCFSGSWEIAQQALGMGFYISLAGPVTFKKAPKLKEIAMRVPADRLLIETDCPFLAPEPFRGRRNEPAYVRYVAEHIAMLRDMPLDELAWITTDNAKKLFNVE